MKRYHIWIYNGSDSYRAEARAASPGVAVNRALPGLLAKLPAPARHDFTLRVTDLGPVEQKGKPV